MSLTTRRRPLYLTNRLINSQVQHDARRSTEHDVCRPGGPTRRAILARLATGECSVTELAEPFDMSMPAVSKHLRVLERAGLDHAGARGAMAALPHRRRAPEAGGRVGRSYRHIWEARLDRLDSYLKTLKAKEKKHARKPAANSGTFKVTTPSDREIVDHAPVRRAPSARLRGDDTSPSTSENGGDPRRRLFGHGVRNRPACGWRLALRRPRPRRASAAFYGVYREIVAPGRLVFTEIFEPFPDVESVVTQLLTKEGGRHG